MMVRMNGIQCPKCTHVVGKKFRFRTVKTMHRVGSVVRVRQCTSCGHEIRTRESVESLQTGKN